MGVKKKLSTSFHPETDGQTERTNQTLEQYLRMYANKLQDNWVELLPTAQLAYNSSKSATTKRSPHYANYGYKPVAHRDPKDIESIAVGAEDKARLMQELHEELSKNIAQQNLTTSRAANKQRIEGLTFKKGDKVFLSRQNLKTKRPCKKLDNLRVGPFEILEEVGKVNYKLKLPQSMRIHPVFHKKLLEPAPPDAELATDIELEDDEYEVEKIIDLQKFRGQWKYLVKWKGWPESHNTWEPEGNLTNSESLVREYHRKYPRKRESDSRRKGRSQGTKDRKKKNQPVTSPGQPSTQMAMVRLLENSYQERNSPWPALSHDPEHQESRGRDERRNALASSPPRARVSVGTTAPQDALLPALSPRALLAPPATLPQKQTNCTQHPLRYTQHSGQRTSQRSTEGSSPHSAYNGNSFLTPPAPHALYGHAFDQLTNKGEGREISVPWAWLGRLKEKNGCDGLGPTDLICSQHHDKRHGKTISQGIETIALKGEVMLRTNKKDSS
ncbi:hypothetical protein ACJQWK_06483 [Exserohilum turcicum]